MQSERARALTRRWLDEWPRAAAASARDADGCHPRHTFFYPAEEYDADCVAMLAELTAAGWGEVEVHLHHRHDTAAGLAARLTAFRDTLRARHGLLGSDAAGRARYAFIHGNWALCNSRPDGDWCGVNEELGVLQSTGCYADFTFPSAPSPTQPRTVNALYRAVDRPGRARGADRGKPMRADGGGARAGLPILQGPLALDWVRRKAGVLPRLDTGELSGVNPPSPRRAGLWSDLRIGVRGRPDWAFVKLFTHGCVPANAEVLLGAPLRDLYARLAEWGVSDERPRVHFASAREFYNIARAAEDGCPGDPGAYRDYEIGRPVAQAGYPHEASASVVKLFPREVRA